MDPVGVKGGRELKVPRKVHGSKAFKMSKLSKNFKGSRTLGVKGCRGPGLIMRFQGFPVDTLGSYPMPLSAPT